MNYSDTTTTTNTSANYSGTTTANFGNITYNGTTDQIIIKDANGNPITTNTKGTGYWYGDGTDKKWTPFKYIDPVNDKEKGWGNTDYWKKIQNDFKEQEEIQKQVQEEKQKKIEEEKRKKEKAKENYENNYDNIIEDLEGLSE